MKEYVLQGLPVAVGADSYSEIVSITFVFFPCLIDDNIHRQRFSRIVSKLNL